MMFNTGLLRVAYGSSLLSRLPANPAKEIHEQFHEGATRSPARQNSSLWLMFARTFAPDGDKRLPRYLRATEFGRVRDGMKRLFTTCADASAFLFAQSAGSFDTLIISNILDLASAEEARELSSAIAHAAKPGAVIVTRAIFSSAAPEFAREALRKDQDLTTQLRDQDRSLICRHATVYRLG
jgi:S-adenosylmethionine:diacylglycerol 3-amino-3-carboxypropyl transferase